MTSTMIYHFNLVTARYIGWMIGFILSIFIVTAMFVWFVAFRILASPKMIVLIVLTVLFIFLLSWGEIR